MPDLFVFPGEGLSISTDAFKPVKGEESKSITAYG